MSNESDLKVFAEWRYILLEQQYLIMPNDDHAGDGRIIQYR